MNNIPELVNDKQIKVVVRDLNDNYSEQIRDIATTYKRDHKTFVHYPKLNPYEHIYETGDGYYIFLSPVK